VIAIGDASILKATAIRCRRYEDGAMAGSPIFPTRRGGSCYRLPLDGTPDQEAVYEIMGADEEARVPFSRALRQRIGVMRLGINDPRDRDLRIGHGGALTGIWKASSSGQSILQQSSTRRFTTGWAMIPKKRSAVSTNNLARRGWPHPVRLGLVGTPGVSLAAGCGLMIGSNDQTARTASDGVREHAGSPHGALLATRK